MIAIAIAIRVAIAIAIVVVFGYWKTANTPHLMSPDCASGGGFVGRFTRMGLVRPRGSRVHELHSVLDQRRQVVSLVEPTLYRKRSLLDRENPVGIGICSRLDLNTLHGFRALHTIPPSRAHTRTRIRSLSPIPLRAHDAGMRLPFRLSQLSTSTKSSAATVGSPGTCTTAAIPQYTSGRIPAHVSPQFGIIAPI